MSGPLTTAVLVDAKLKAIHGVRFYSWRLGDDYEPEWMYYPRECVYTFDMTSSLGIRVMLNELVNQNLTM